MMVEHTQAHLSRTIESSLPNSVKEKTKRQMEYYMGAKLIEIGIDRKSAIYRWSVEKQENSETWTYSAYWGDSKEKLSRIAPPLIGAELIDCARANASEGVEKTAMLSGYGQDLNSFRQALQEAGAEMGLAIESLKDLLGPPPSLKPRKNIEIAPETPNTL
ncbi:MAG: hypothetical protein QNJ38_10675 [Prochloraceae cyanobacterium]|nr:hypothetical protein [Prochloraceae cyanobacterium]